jgi:hypothetical protein
MAITTITAAGAAPAPTRNAALIQDVAECIESFPEQYSPNNYWIGTADQLGDDIQNITMNDGRVYENIPVGDSQDIVGWTCLLSGWLPDTTKKGGGTWWRKPGDGVPFRGTDIAQKALGLTAAEARRLFAIGWQPGASRGKTLPVQTASALRDIANGAKL